MMQQMATDPLPYKPFLVQGKILQQIFGRRFFFLLWENNGCLRINQTLFNRVMRPTHITL